MKKKREKKINKKKIKKKTRKKKKIAIQKIDYLIQILEDQTYLVYQKTNNLKMNLKKVSQIKNKNRLIKMILNPQ